MGLSAGAPPLGEVEAPRDRTQGIVSRHTTKKFRFVAFSSETGSGYREYREKTRHTSSAVAIQPFQTLQGEETLRYGLFMQRRISRIYLVPLAA